MKTRKRAEVHRAIVILFRKKIGGVERLLIGNSKNKFCNKKEISPGGHIERGETMFDTAMHEGPDECGLTPKRKSLRHVGKLQVRYSHGLVINIDFLETRHWSGDLKATPNKDFRTLGFKDINNLPWSKMPKCDPPIIMAMMRGFFVTAKAWFGETLDDFRGCQIKLRPLD